MNSRYFGLLFSIVVFSFMLPRPVLSQEAQHNEQATTGARLLTDQTNGSDAEGLFAGVSIGFYNGVGAFGVLGSYRLSEDIDAIMAYQNGEDSILGNVQKDVQGVEVQRAVSSIQRFEAAARLFFTETAFVKTGLAAVKYRQDLTFKLHRFFNQASSEVTTDRTEFVIAIGNRWKFKQGFRIDCEWISIGQPLGVNVSENYYSTVSDSDLPSTKMKDYQGKFIKNFKNNVAISVGQFAVGYDF